MKIIQSWIQRDMYEADVEVGVVWEDEAGTSHRAALRTRDGKLPRAELLTLPADIQHLLQIRVAGGSYD
jgi:hypothetical protein